MPQVAQQDYIRIAVDNLSLPTAEERAEIRKHVQNGTIWDAIIADSDGAFGRVLSVVPPSEQIIVYSVSGGEIQPVDYGE